MHLALVVDRSSSMAGAKIRQVKAAAHALVGQLGALDTLTILSYGADVSVELPITAATSSQALASMDQAIDAIELGGSTYISGAMEQACDTLAAAPREGAIQRVLLLSDGQANIGTTSATGLAAIAAGCLERGVSITTMGVGLDYNEDSMTQIAISGAGNYHFLDEDKLMGPIFAAEAAGLSSSVASRARLTILLAPGVELLDLTGYAYKANGNKLTLDLAAFHARQRKDLVLKLAVSPQHADKQEILRVSMAYTDAVTNKRRNRTQLLSAQLTDDPKRVKRIGAVMDRVQRVEVARSMHEAMDAYEQGDVQRAQKVIKDQRAAMKAARKQYDFADDAAYERVDQELEQVEQEVQSNGSSSDSARKLRKSVKARSYNISQDNLAF
jgi:Ca-activated chloride channel homolog